jgi:fused signal recognition particle receptor
VEIAVAVMLVIVVLAFVFVQLSNARRAAGTPPVEAPAPPSPSAPALRRDGLGARVRSLLATDGGEERWGDLHDTLLKADVGPTAATALVERVRARWARGADAEVLLREEIVQLLDGDGSPERSDATDRAGDGVPDPGAVDGAAREPAVILVVGVNGTGKTTTIGKLARRLAGEGHRVSLGGSEKFRAAAGEQLEVWAVRARAHLVSQERGGDPGAVVFDAVTSARARGSDVLIVDTAGRLHTKAPLMDELRKLVRVVDKAGGRVAETLLVLDATTGQNGIAQAKAFTEAVDVTGVVLTKVDGSAKGGVVLAVRGELGVPVRFIGTGEGPDDLQPFRPAAFADRILAS